MLELEPSEAEKLLIPLIGAESVSFLEINEMIANGEVEKALGVNDEILLVQGLGLTRRDVRKLRASWCKLRDRRINRNHN